jgi:hypothetical protein
MDIAFIIGFSLGGISAILLAGFMQLCLFPYARAALSKGTARHPHNNSPPSDGSKG